MPRIKTGVNLVEATINRFRSLYKDPLKRIILSFSGGKESTVLLELAIQAARQEKRLPVEAAILDEELFFPPTRDYQLRIAQRKDVKLYWYYANSPRPNSLCREAPLWWTYDEPLKSRWIYPLFPQSQLIPPDEGYYRIFINELRFPSLGKARTVPFECDHCYAENQVPTPTRWEGKKNIGSEFHICTSCKKRFECEWWPGSDMAPVYGAYGYRAQEGPGRNIKASRIGWMSLKSLDLWPLYDWTFKDIWLAISKFKWDYNKSYDLMIKAGWEEKDLTTGGTYLEDWKMISYLMRAKTLWPKWYEKILNRVPVTLLSIPDKSPRETYQQTFRRQCLKEAPTWISERATKVETSVLKSHSIHSTDSFPDSKSCSSCRMGLGSYKDLFLKTYNGDPLAMHCPSIKPVDPKPHRAEFLRRMGVKE